MQMMAVMWFCEKCNTKLHDTRFHWQISKKISYPDLKNNYASEEARSVLMRACDGVDPRFVS